ERAVRAAGEQQPEKVLTIVEDSMEEWKEVAWIRIADSNGKPMAEVFHPGIDPQSVLPAQRGRPAFPGLGEPEIRQSALGRVLVGRYSFLPAIPPRPGRPPRPAGRPAAGSVEIALILDSVSTSFASLRLYLIVGVTAALALMGALIFIRLRFPHYLRGQQIEGQLELARHVQADLLPSGRQVSPSLDFATECIS